MAGLTLFETTVSLDCDSETLQVSSLVFYVLHCDLKIHRKTNKQNLHSKTAEKTSILLAMPWEVQNSVTLTASECQEGAIPHPQKQIKT